MLWLYFFLLKHTFFLDFKNKLKAGIIILFLVISQVSLFYVISSSRNVETIIIQNNTETKKEEIIKKKENVIHFRSFNHPEKTGFDLIQQVLLSGRVALWQDSLKLFLERPILGYGSMSDRIVFSKKRRDKTISNNPVSNAFVYSLLSGGLFALILLIYFWINIRQKIFKIFQFNKDHNYEVKIGSFLIFVILLRSLVENSMMLFGVDFIILLNSLYLTKQK